MSKNNIVPLSINREFGIDLSYGHYDNVIKTIQDYNLDINAFVREESNETILMRCVWVKPDENVKLIKYLLEQGADPNILNKEGSSAFHILFYETNIYKVEAYLNCIALFLDYGAEVNLKDEYGSPPFYTLLQGFYRNTAHMGVPIKNKCLSVMETLLRKGADPYLSNSYGRSFKDFFSYEMESVRRLVAKYDAMDIKKSIPPKKVLKTNLKYPDIAKEIWQTYVPKSGESNTVQGELLRCLEKLRDEAQRNGNINYRDWHKSLAVYIRDTLISYNMFDENEIKEDIKFLMHKNQPYIDDDIYERFTDKICEFYLKYKEPIYRTVNPNN